MGYTHYYTIRNWDSPEWKTAWPQLIQDVPSIISTANIPLQGHYDPSTDEDQQPPPQIDLQRGIVLNGVEKGAHEDLVIARDSDDFFVKTNRKPYDKVVACVLLRAYMLAPEQFKLRSDGFWDYEDEWGAVRDLYGRIWPGEEIRRPWGENEDDGVGEADDIEENHYMG